MILHLMINSLIVFIGLAFFVELLLYVFKIKNSRICYICRTLPFLKIPFDALILGFYGDSLFINLNPLSCEIYVHELLSHFFSNSLQISSAHMHLIIPQYIALQISSFWLNLLTMLVSMMALGGFFLKLRKLVSSRKYLRKIVRDATPYHASIVNPSLRKQLKSSHVRILVSQEIQIPFAANPSYILLPQKMLRKLSNEESEAVIAHELQHLRWKDPLFKFIYSLICSVCWWIPTEWWLNRLIADQELASDAGIDNYDIDSYALASAVTKILHNAKDAQLDTTAICLLGSSKNAHMSRLKYLLDTSAFSLSSHYDVKSIMGAIFGFLAFLSLWMC